MDKHVLVVAYKTHYIHNGERIDYWAIRQWTFNTKESAEEFFTQLEKLEFKLVAIWKIPC